MTNDKSDATIKKATKKKVTVMVPHLFEIVSEDKATGTLTLKEWPLPKESKRGGTRSEKIQNGVLEAADAGDPSYTGKDFTILYSNIDEFAVRVRSVTVANKRD